MRDLIAAGAAATAAATGSVFTNAAFVPYIGQPLSVLLMACCGALIAMSISDPMPTRMKMWGWAAASAFIGTALVSVYPQVWGFGWTTNVPPQVLGMLGGFFCRWVIPQAIDFLKEGKVPNFATVIINRYKGGK